MDEVRKALQGAREARKNHLMKGFEPTFSASDDIEKARAVGEFHANGKWVWTEYQPGKYDWRTAKKGSRGVPKRPTNKVRAVRSRNVEEAEAWAERYIKSVGKADYSGIAIGDANKVNKVLIDLQNEGILRGNRTFIFTPFKGKAGNDAAGGSYQMMKHSHGGTANLRIDVKFETDINRSIRKAKRYHEKMYEQALESSKKVLEDAKHEIDINDHSPSGWKYAQEGRRELLNKVIAYHEDRQENFRDTFDQETGDRYMPRFNTRARTMEDALIHEYGHILNADLQTNAEDYPKEALSIVRKLKQEGGYKVDNKNLLYSPHDNFLDKRAWKYGREVSDYASTCGAEYFAESFLMYKQVGSLPDKELEKLFKILIK